MIDLGQATVLPGLIDARTHIFSSLSNGARITTSKDAWTLMAAQNAQTTLRAGFTAARGAETHGDAINRGMNVGSCSNHGRTKCWRATTAVQRNQSDGVVPVRCAHVKD